MDIVYSYPCDILYLLQCTYVSLSMYIYSIAAGCSMEQQYNNIILSYSCDHDNFFANFINLEITIYNQHFNCHNLKSWLASIEI